MEDLVFEEALLLGVSSDASLCLRSLDLVREIGFVVVENVDGAATVDVVLSAVEGRDAAHTALYGLFFAHTRQRLVRTVVRARSLG